MPPLEIRDSGWKDYMPFPRAGEKIGEKHFYIDEKHGLG